MYYPTLALYTLILYKKYDKEIMNSNLVSSLRYNKSTREISLEYYPKNIPIVVNNKLNASDCFLEHHSTNNKEYFIIRTIDNSFLLPVDPLRSQIDSVLLKEIFRPEKDPLFYSAVIAKNKGFILDCPYTSNPNSSLDLLLRESLLKEKDPDFDKLTQVEIKEKLLNITDKEVELHKEKLSNIIHKDYGLDKIESTLSSIGILKAKEAAKFLNEEFLVESLSHLKHLGDYELNCLAKHIDLSANELSNLISNLKEKIN